MTTEPASAAPTPARRTGPLRERFDGRTAIVTGGGSGIGRALGAELAARGATVVLADVDLAAAAAAAAEIGPRSPGSVTAAELDVRDADAVADLVERVASDHVRLDYLFNNAGVAVGGDTAQLSVAHWDRVIDVNLRGVVHGVAAAYPRMVRQGSGHIVNTASLAGLFPSPTLVPYAATKHAVVGLSISLRAEAACNGVRVTALCPGFVDTPLLDHVNEGLPGPRPGRELLRRVPGGLYTPDALARDALDGVARNRALVVAPSVARNAWRGYRLAPTVVLAAATRTARRLLGDLHAG